MARGKGFDHRKLRLPAGHHGGSLIISHAATFLLLLVLPFSGPDIITLGIRSAAAPAIVLAAAEVAADHQLGHIAGEDHSLWTSGITSSGHVSQPAATGAADNEKLQQEESRSRESGRPSASMTMLPLWLAAALEEKVWPPFEPNLRVIFASLITLLGAALSNAGGVGGGGIFVPMFNLLLGYDAKTSAALSKSMIMGGAIASVFFNVQQRHPYKPERPLINYKIARLMQPMLLLGISVGVTCNVIFPPWLIVLLLSTLLSLMTFKTVEKGIECYLKEERCARNLRPLTDEDLEECGSRRGRREYDPLPDGPSGAEGERLGAEAARKRSEEAEAEFAPGLVENAPEEKDETSEPRASPSGIGSSLLVGKEGDEAQSKDEGEHAERGPSKRSFLKNLSEHAESISQAVAGLLVDWPRVAVLSAIWVVYVAIQVLREATPRCSLNYWLLTSLQLPLSIVPTAVAIRTLLAEQRRSDAQVATALEGEAEGGAQSIENGNNDGIVNVEGSESKGGEEEEVKWGLGAVVSYPFFALLAGTMGGLLGIGGGMVMGPVLLELGLCPQVTSATSTFIVVFSSSLSVIEFYMLGRIPIDVAIYFCILAMIAAFTGLTIVKAIVLRSGKASIIIFSLASVIGISAVILGSIGGIRIYEEWTSGEDMGFRDLCGN